MIGAKVNNRIVPIEHQVATGEIIEIITGPENRGPSRDWLGIVKTSEAKSKIRNWFKKERREENIVEGKDALEREMRRNMMTVPPEKSEEFLASLARRNHCNTVEELYAAIGYGGLQMARILPSSRMNTTASKPRWPNPSRSRWTSKPRTPAAASLWKASTTARSNSPSAARRCPAMRSSALSRAASAFPSTKRTAPTCAKACATPKTAPAGSTPTGPTMCGGL